MKIKGKPDSKIPTTGTNTNKKKDMEDKRFDPAFFKKNEFALIMIGALLLTVIIFFVFFKSSEPESEAIVNAGSGASFAELENRIKALENDMGQAQENADKSITQSQDGPDSALVGVNEKIIRLETALMLKFDSMVERLEKLEKKLAEAVVEKNGAKSAATVVKKANAPVKKAVPKPQKASMFHTVKKGETLYSISKKYNTSVAALKKINNLSEKDKIYPGSNIIIR